jgi:hypothetical protein
LMGCRDEATTKGLFMRAEHALFVGRTACS